MCRGPCITLTVYAQQSHQHLSSLPVLASHAVAYSPAYELRIGNSEYLDGGGYIQFFRFSGVRTEVIF